jgi:hypothetical protein
MINVKCDPCRDIDYAFLGPTCLDNQPGTGLVIGKDPVTGINMESTVSHKTHFLRRVI